jgi:hypothetical protein
MHDIDKDSEKEEALRLEQKASRLRVGLRVGVPSKGVAKNYESGMALWHHSSTTVSPWCPYHRCTSGYVTGLSQRRGPTIQNVTRAE